MHLNIDYAYLFLTAPFVVCWICFYVFGSKSSRRHQLKRSLVAAPTGPVAELLYFRDYWMPQSVFWTKFFSVPVLLEDLLFAFSMAGIGSVCYEVFFRKRRICEAKMLAMEKALLFLLVVSSAYALIWGVTIWGGINSIFATVIVLLLLSLLCLVKRTDLLGPAIFTAVFVSLFVFLVYSVGFLLVYNAEQILSGWWYLYGAPAGIRFCRIPVTEILWAFAYGFACPVIFTIITKTKYC